MSRILYLFRNNLRLHDNPSFQKALEEADELIPLYILDERLVGKSGKFKIGPHRQRFLLSSLFIFREQLRSLGTELFILSGSAINTVSELLVELKPDKMITSKEAGWHECSDDLNYAQLLPFTSIDDQSLVRTSELPFPLEKLPSGFSSFRKKIEKNLVLREPGVDITGLPPFLPIKQIRTFDIDTRDLPPPDVRTAFPYNAGEYAAKEHLQEYIWETQLIRSYKETRNALMGKYGSSKFSPWLSAGSISPLTLWKEIESHESVHGKNESTYWLKFELLWREFFRHTAYLHGKKFYLKGGIQGIDREFKREHSLLESWKCGQTGVDLVDACMLELRETGYMSNRGRQNAASFLIHNLGVDWREGAAYFESQLIDYDASSNWGNWMYIAGVGNSKEPKKFDIEQQSAFYDPDKSFRKLWLT